MVWPIHCEIGSWGHNVHADVRAAYNRWEDAGQHIVRKVPKGTNPWTEHYSALMAEVPDPDDPRTQLNRGLLDALDRAELLLIAGEAGSHCVKATVEDLAQHLPGGKLSRVVLLTDCMSPVPGFNAGQTAFLQRANWACRPAAAWTCCNRCARWPAVRTGSANEHGREHAHRGRDQEERDGSGAPRLSPARHVERADGLAEGRRLLEQA